MRRFAKVLLSLPCLNIKNFSMKQRNTLAFSRKNGGG
mgnify:FL=1